MNIQLKKNGIVCSSEFSESSEDNIAKFTSEYIEVNEFYEN